MKRALALAAMSIALCVAVVFGQGACAGAPEVGARIIPSRAPHLSTPLPR